MHITSYLNKVILGPWETKPEYSPKPGYVWLNKPDRHIKEIFTRYAAIAIFLDYSASPQKSPLIACGFSVLFLGIQILNFPPAYDKDIEKAILKAKKYTSLPFFIVLIALVSAQILNLKTKPLIGLSAYFSFLFFSYFIHRRTFKTISQKSEIEGLDFKDIPTMHSGQILDLSHSDMDDAYLELLCAKSFKKGEENNYDLNLTRCPSISYEGVSKVLAYFPNQLRITLTASALSNDDIYKLKIQNKAEIFCDPFYHNSYHLFKKQNPADFDLVFVFNQKSRGGLESLEEEKFEDDSKSVERHIKRIYAHSRFLGIKKPAEQQNSTQSVVDASIYDRNDLEAFLADLYCKNLNKEFSAKLDDLKKGPLADYFQFVEDLKEIKFKKDTILESSSGEQFKVCRWRLICRLPYFDTVLNSPGREKNESLIKLALTADELKLLLQFIKTGDEAIILNNHPMFSKQLHLFEGVPSITEPLKMTLMDQKPLSLNNVAKRLILAETHHMEALKKECHTFLREKLSISVTCEPSGILSATIYDKRNLPTKAIFDWLTQYTARTLESLHFEIKSIYGHSSIILGNIEFRDHDGPSRFRGDIDPQFGNYFKLAIPKLIKLKEILIIDVKNNFSNKIDFVQDYVQDFPQICVKNGSKDRRKISIPLNKFLAFSKEDIETIASICESLTLQGGVDIDSVNLDNLSYLSYFKNLLTFNCILELQIDRVALFSSNSNITKHITSLLNNNPQLKEINLLCRFEIFHDDDFAKSFFKLHNLERISLRGDGSSLVFPHNVDFPKLQYLKLSNFEISPTSLKSILLKSKKLTFLSILDQGGIDDDSFEQIFNFPMALTLFIFDSKRFRHGIDRARIQKFMPLLEAFILPLPVLGD